MRRAALIAAVVAGALTASPSTTRAQLGYLWSYEELLQKADVVLIAECQITTDTGRRRPHPDLVPALRVIEWETAFRVAAVLKAGQEVAVASELHLRHYWYDDDVLQGGIVNGGSSLILQPQRSYLMFLTRAGDGVYEPLSGHTFPNDSVYLLDRMSADRMSAVGRSNRARGGARQGHEADQP